MLLVAKTAQGKGLLVYFSKQEDTQLCVTFLKDLFDQYVNSNIVVVLIDTANAK